MKPAVLFAAVLPLCAAELSTQTLKEFQAYMEVADRSMTERAAKKTSLSIPDNGYRVTPWEAAGFREVTHGLIHDWTGATFLPKAKVSDVLAVLQDYGNYTRFYRPDLLRVKLNKQQGDQRQVSMRVLKKKVLTVVLDIDYDIEYRTYPNGVAQVWSRSTRILEVENAGKSTEKQSAPDTGYGFLWRLNTYWQVQERPGGVYMECRAISLTRDVPPGLGWAVKPMVTSLPRESLIHTLESTRRAVEERID